MKNFKLFIIGIALFILLAISLLMCNSQVEHEDASTPTTAQGLDTIPMLITQVQRCARLYTAEYRVHKILTHDDVVRLKGSLLKHSFNIKMPLGDRKETEGLHRLQRIFGKQYRAPRREDNHHPSRP